MTTINKTIHDAGNALTKKQMEIVFPQLAESEDERIRKFLVDYFASYKIGNVTTKLNGVRIDDILNYLEKQKEPHFTKRNALFDKCVENCDPEIMKRVSDEVDEMLQKEQKPAEWSEEDEDMLNSCISSIEEAKENRYAYKETDGDTSYDREVDWLESLRNRVGKESLQPHWKPAEELIARLEQWLKDKQFDGDSRSVYPIFESLYKLLKLL